MRRVLLITGITLSLLLLTLLVAPFLFRDNIKTLVLTEINRSLKAEVYVGDVGLSFIRNFPNARISIRDYGVVGLDIFAGDTLIHGSSFDLVVDLWSVIGGGEIQLRKILLDKPVINMIVLKDGSYNWDIVRVDSTAAVSTDTSTFRAALNAYGLTDATIRYADATFPMEMEIKGLNHTGKGDFTLDVYNLDTYSTAEALTYTYDGISYLSQARATADARLHIDLKQNYKFEMLDNLFTLNDFAFSMDGWFNMPGEDIMMDLTFATPSNDFRSLFSLVPGVYTASFGEIKTEGSLAFDGHVKGIYNATRIPGFGVNLKIGNGKIQYPGLPKPVSGIQADMSILNPDGDLEHTAINIRQLHADFGDNPLDARGTLEGMSRVKLDGFLKARLNLGELTSMFPLEGTDLKGTFSIDATASGVYDTLAGTFPTVDARMAMENGYVKNTAYPATLSGLQFHARLQDSDGKLSTAVFDMPDFGFSLDGEPVAGALHVENFDNPAYQLQARGNLDLEKLMQLYPVDSLSLKGKIKVNSFSTAGQYADIEAGRYTNLPTSGEIQVENLVYAAPGMPAPVTLSQGTATFTPSQIELTSVQGQAGRSDFTLGGTITHYLAYALIPGSSLQGDLSLRSQRLDLNEWMATAPAPAPSDTAVPPAPMEVIPVPDNLDIRFQTEIGELIYSNLNLTGLKGRMDIADQTLALQDLGFSMLGSRVQMSGEYNTTDTRRPLYHFYLNIKQLVVKEFARHFASVRQLAPVLELIEGICDTEFGIQGRLKPNMMPVLEEITSLGAFQLKQGGISQAPMLTALSEKTRLSGLSKLDLRDIAGSFEVKDGFLKVSPFTLKAGDVNITIGGRQNLAGALDYAVQIDAPSTAIDQTAMAALSSLTGTSLQTSDRVNFNLRVTGPFKAPKVSGAGGGTGDAVKDQLTAAAEQKLQEQLGTDVSLNKDSLKAQAQDAVQQAKDTLRATAQQAQQQAKDSIQRAADRVRQQAEEEAKRKAEELLSPTTQEQLKNLKDKFGLPKKKSGGG
ncbi:MAG: AsmA-like C-terminal region-containing protein [Bacteroidia bacterium]|nr:AsmA-like C-terminal region-containing protein [Bacteroidia bacterium]